jgi:eukaryotic-like serine/threonine-protein kinase
MLAPDDLLNNRYRILALLGEGGMGAVYRARDETLDTIVAVKENQVVTAAAQRQFEREARLLAGLRHMNLPRVTDHFLIAGQGQYLVMDFVEGEDLSRRLARLGRLPEASVLEWAQHILEALAYLHGRGIIHRDIKPANIKITPDGRATLVDFGIAKVVGTGQTTTGARGLTPGYAPPEQYGFGSTDVRSDLYSFAATLYNALTGQVPADAAARLIQKTRLVPMRELEPAVSDKTAEAIEIGLSLAIDERWRTAEDMRQALVPETRHPPVPTPPAPTSYETVVEPPAPAEERVLQPEPPSAPPPPSPAAPDSGTAPRPLTAPAPSRRNWIGVGILSLFGLVGLGLLAVIGLIINSGLQRRANATPTAAVAAVAPAPHPSKIAFASDRNGNWEIYLANLDGSDVVNLSNHPADDSKPAFSPDGTKIAFVSNRGGSDAIYVMNADGSNVVKMTSSTGDENWPAWSPDGGTLAFASNRDGNWEIYISGANGITRLTNQPGQDRQPSWNYTGDLIAFTSDRDGNDEIYVAGPSGLQRYTNNPAEDSNPRWSPTADNLAFVSKRDGNAEIYLFTLNGTERYTDNPAFDGNPAWSPDGASLAFESDRDGNPEIYLLGPGGLTRFTNNPAADTDPAWQP